MRAVIFPILCCLVSATNLFAQSDYLASVDTLGLSILQEDDEKEPSSNFCTPGILNKSRSRGVDIAFNFLNGGAMRSESGGPGESAGQLNSLQSIILKVKVPLVNRPNFKLLLGYSFMPERYYFSSIPNDYNLALAGPSFSDVFNDLDSRQLKHNSFNLYAMKPLDERHYLSFRFSAAFNGDYQGWNRFDQRYAIYSATAAYSIKKSEDYEYGFGVALRHSFRRSLALPFFIYNRNFNAKWGLETVFPAYVNGRYNFNPKTILMFGYQYNSASYSVDIHGTMSEQPHVYHLSHREVLVGASIERQVVPWVWVNLKAGIQLNLPTQFEATLDGDTSYSVMPAHTPYLRAGIFISPPDRFCR